MKCIFSGAVLWLVFFNLHAQNSLFNGYENLMNQPLSYVIHKTSDSLQIDGNAVEPSWLKASWSEYFSDIEGDLQSKPVYNSRFKMLWSTNELYIYAELQEPHIWATLKERDQVVFHDNDFEVFIDPEGDAQNYFEIEVNAFKNVFDLFLPKPYRNGGSALISWDVRQLKLGVVIDGTINNPNDVDRRWCIEMAIPFKNISVGNDVHIPVEGSLWRINFSRVEWDVEVKDNTYQKKVNPATKTVYPEHNWVWSPQGVINMHYPERWGYAIFSSAIVGSFSATTTVLPQVEQIKKYLWLVYYKQIDYRKSHSSYANDLHALGFIDDYFLIEGERYNLLLESSVNQFLASVTKVVTGESWQINQRGYISKKSG
jgi:hypothetical protein